MNYKELRLGNLVNDKRQPPYSPVIYHPSIVNMKLHLELLVFQI